MATPNTAVVASNARIVEKRFNFKPSKYLEGYFYSVSLGLTKISPVP